MLRGVADDVMERVGSVADRFDIHSRSLSEAARNVSEANRQIESTIGERRQALEQLAQSLNQRSDAIEIMIKTFSETVEKALKNAEKRAATVSKSLGENASVASRAVVEQLEKVNFNTAEEGQKAAGAIEDASKSLSDQLGGAIKNATAQFAEATVDIRKVAKQMEEELRTTREELKKGVFQLPQETRDNADSMRKVVAEQIEALSELAKIVNRNGGSLGVARPDRSPSSEQRAPIAAAAASRPQPAASRSAAVMPKATPKPVPSQTRRPASGSSKQQEVEARKSGKSGGKGWMSSLLRRASQEGEPTEGHDIAAVPGKSGGASQSTGNGGMATALGSLSADDLAKAIDEKTSVEVWRRHNCGEKNSFTRRLYTLQGQQTFDEIKAKYGKNKDFKSAVDRYVVDFERLLSEVTKNGADTEAGDPYLVSTKGKVYTMLAHASGRFD